MSGKKIAVPQGRERGWDLQLYSHLATFESRSLPFLIKFLQKSHQKHSFRLLFRHIWDSCVETPPDGDLENLADIFKIMGHNCAHASWWGFENLAIEKCTARNLKITLLHSAPHGVLDLVALTCLASWMRGVPCSFYLVSTYALTFTSQCKDQASQLMPEHDLEIYTYILYISIFAYMYLFLRLQTNILFMGTQRRRQYQNGDKKHYSLLLRAMLSHKNVWHADPQTICWLLTHDHFVLR